MLDKSKGLVLGAELVTNGTFDTDSDWTKGTGWVISGGSATLTARAPKGFAASSTITASRLAAAQSSYYVQTAPVQCYNSGSCASQCGGCGTFYEPGNPTWNGVGGFWSCCDQGYFQFFYINYAGSGYTWGGSNYTNGSGEWWRIV
jgi:hypothetical protein